MQDGGAEVLQFFFLADGFEDFVAGSGGFGLIFGCDETLGTLLASTEHVASGTDEIALQAAFGGDEVARVCEQREKHFLDDFFGGFDLTGHVECETKNRCLMALIESEESRFVALGGEVEEVGVGIQSGLS